MLIKLLLVLFITSTTSLTQAAVWETKHQWDDNWEQRFSEWVELSFHADIFSSGPYADIPHDCADAAYFARLIFAYENSLPFKISNPQILKHTNRHDKVIQDYVLSANFLGNDMPHFDQLEPKQRLRAFMLFIGEQVWSRSLVNDTYPVQLEVDTFRPGVVAVLPRSRLDGDTEPSEPQPENLISAGHAQIVKRIDPKGIIHYLKSSLPAKTGQLESTTLNTFQPDSLGGSFRYWKQPAHYALAEEQIPGYGTEQLELETELEYVVQQRLAMTTETSKEKMARYALEACKQIRQRVPVVIDAWQHKTAVNNRCLDFDEYDNYSTPLRDKKIKKTLSYLSDMIEHQQMTDDVIVELLQQQCDFLQVNDKVAINPGFFAKQLLSDNRHLSDPNQPPAVRWGLENKPQSGCKTYY